MLDTQVISDLLTLRYLMRREAARLQSAAPQLKHRLEGESIQEKFEQFHRDNPHVVHLFAWFAFELKLNDKKGSAKLIFERLRWEIALSTLDNEFKLNNNYSSRMARLVSRRFPSLEGSFETRVLQSH